MLEKNLRSVLSVSVLMFTMSTPVSASISGPVDLSVASTNTFLNLNLSATGNIYLDFSAISGVFSMVNWTLNADAGIEFHDSTSASSPSWPYTSPLTHSTNDANNLDVTGDVLLRVDADWQFSDVSLTTPQFLYAFDVPELAVWGDLNIQTSGDLALYSSLTADTVGPAQTGGRVTISTGSSGGTITTGDNSIVLINNDPVIIDGSVTITLDSPTLTLVPLPASLLLFLSAGSILAWFQRGRKSF